MFSYYKSFIPRFSIRVFNRLTQRTVVLRSTIAFRILYNKAAQPVIYDDQYFNSHVEMTTLTPPLFITVPVPQVSSAVYTTSTVSGHVYVCLGYWFDFGTVLKV